MSVQAILLNQICSAMIINRTIDAIYRQNSRLLDVYFHTCHRLIGRIVALIRNSVYFLSPHFLSLIDSVYRQALVFKGNGLDATDNPSVMLLMEKKKVGG